MANAATIPTGNVDVSRDLSDVRDVVRAYRLLLEAAVAGSLGVPPTIVNVASGRVVTVRWVIEQLCALAGVQPALEVDASLVRASDPVEIAGDSSLLTSLTGWRPTIPLEQTLADVLSDAAHEHQTQGGAIMDPR